VTAALALLAAAVALWPEPARFTTARLRALGWRRSPGRRRRGAGGLPDGPVRRWLLAACAAAPVALLVGGVTGAGAGAVILVLAERGLRRAAVTGRAQEAGAPGELPVACDLLAVCLSAGVPLSTALVAVGGAVRGGLGAELEQVAGLSRLGADARRAWQDVPAALEPLGRVLRRTEDSGARAAAALHALAAETRAAARAETDVAVRRAGVQVLAPLGLCFLPGFVCLGVVPLVIGIAGEVLG
jgi:pilus assembly protein TadC